MTRYIFFAIVMAALLLTGCGQPETQVEFVRSECGDSTLLAPNHPSKSPVCHARISLVMLKPTAGGKSTEAIKLINQYIIHELLPDNPQATPDNAAQLYIAQQTDEFSKLVRDIYDEDLRLITEQMESQSDSDQHIVRQSMIASYSYTYDIQTEAHIGYADSVVCYTIRAYEYTGGAHGMTTFTTLTFSLKTGDLISPVEVFRDDTSDALCDRIYKKILKQQNVKSEQELQELGFVERDDLFLPNNMLLDPDSIHFLYNAYDIAPYVFGEIRVGFRYAELKDLIR